MNHYSITKFNIFHKYIDFVGFQAIRFCNLINNKCYPGGGILPTVLMQAQIEVISNEECAARTNPNWVNFAHVCVYDQNSNGIQGGCNVSLLVSGLGLKLKFRLKNVFIQPIVHIP